MSRFRDVFKKRSAFLWPILGLLVLTFSTTTPAMSPLDDAAMGEVVGQAAFYTNYSSKTGSGEVGNTESFGFFTLGVQGIVSLNANIQHIQLGCGGVNGPGCDIDINNLSLSGTPSSCASGAPRASCDATITNPFFRLAIKNPTSLSTRTLAGFQFGAQQLIGLLTAGNNDGTANGINALSGSLSIASATGTTSTQAANFTNPVSGKANIGGCISGCPVTFNTDGKPLTIPSMSVSFTTDPFNLSGTRLTAANLTALATVPDIPLTEASGTRTATMPGCFWELIIPLCGYKINDLRIVGNIHGLKTSITINEALGYIHSLPLNNPLSLSVQSQPILWPNQTQVANKGWWLSVTDPINLGSLTTAAGYQADISAAFPQVAAKITAFLNANPINISFGDAVGSVFTSKLVANVGTIDLSQASAATLGLSNLPLGTAQNVTPNCYGTLKFC